MRINDFDRRFAAKDEKSFLFEILRRVGRLDQRTVLAASDGGWLIWDGNGTPDPAPGDGSGVGLAHA
jgi:hypothetical protein